MAEAAELLGITRSALAARRSASGFAPGYRGYGTRPLLFPEPVAQLRCGPIWLRADVEEYQRAYLARWRF